MDNPSTGPGQRRSWFPVLAVYLGALATLFAVDCLWFRAGWYLKLLEPDSYAGRVILLVRRIGEHPPDPARDIVVMGDSRIAEGFWSGKANQYAPERRFFNGSIHGSDWRCWYYLLREVDPQAQRFRAIVLPVDKYEDEDPLVDPADALMDIHIAAPLLRWADALLFPYAFHGANRTDALRACLYRGLGLRDDVRAFLANPSARTKKVRQAWEFRDWPDQHYSGSSRSLAGSSVDWEHHTVALPPAYSPAEQDMIRNALFHDPVPQKGMMARFRKEWFTRILERYRNSKTKMVFLRLPSSPWPRPPATRLSSVRELAPRYGAVLLDERLFLPLEKPEYFSDQLHLNGAGRARFTLLLADAVRGL